MTNTASSKTDLNREAVKIWLAHGGLDYGVEHRPIGGDSWFSVIGPRGLNIQVEAYPQTSSFRLSVRSDVSGNWGDICLGGGEAHLAAEWIALIQEVDALLVGGYTERERVLALRARYYAWRNQPGAKRTGYNDRTLARWFFLILNALVGAETPDDDA